MRLKGTGDSSARSHTETAADCERREANDIFAEVTQENIADENA